MHENNTARFAFDTSGNSGESKSLSWFKAIRSDNGLELIRLNAKAFALAYIIASRARYREGFSADGLVPGEAMLGDFTVYNMTRQQYRSALGQLVKHGFATIRRTSKGTIARLTDARLFDPLNLTVNQQNNHQSTSGQPPANQPTTTNEEGNNGRKKEIKNDSIKDSLASLKMNPKAGRIVALMEDCNSLFGEDELIRFHRRWLRRAEETPELLRRVLADTRQAVKDGDVKTTPAKYAENRFKEFGPKRYKILQGNDETSACH